MQSDRGTQLITAAKEGAQWDFSGIQEWCAVQGFKWNFVPTGGQHMNGQAEGMIGLVKKSIFSTLENRPCTFNELLTVLAEATLIVNSRPIGVAGQVEDTEAEMAVTPLHLMLGRVTAEAPQICLEEPVTTECRLQFLEELRGASGTSGGRSSSRASTGPQNGGMSIGIFAREMWCC